MVLVNVSIEERLESARIKLGNARNDKVIGPLMLPMGYDEVRWSEGEALYKNAFDLNLKQKQNYGDRFYITEKMQTEWNRLNRVVSGHVAIARVALDGEPSLQKKTGILGERQSSWYGWFSQVGMLYYNALEAPEVLAALASYGLSVETLTATLAEIEALRGQRDSQNIKTGEAENLTKERDAALDALESWVSKMVRIAKVVLVDSPQLLEKLGIKVRS